MPTTARQLPRTQADGNVNPVESPAVRKALAACYLALFDAHDKGVIDQVGEYLFMPEVGEKLAEALAEIENNASPNFLVTVLPGYTVVNFATVDVPRVRKGIIRDGAWGLYPDRPNATERRITVEGWEFFVTPETEFTYFEVVEFGR